MRCVRNTICICLLSFAILPEVWAGPHASVRSGPMVGYGEMKEVMLWVQTTGSAKVQYQYWIEGEKNNKWLTEKQAVGASTEFTAHTVIHSLPEGKRFEYEILLDGKVFQRPYPLHFQTQSYWQWRKDPPPFTVAIGSCAYVNDTPDDRPGTPYGTDYEIFTALAAQKPDLMIWLGDNCYYREDDWTSVSRMIYRNAHTRALPQMQPLLGATHNYAIWDDHDFGPNDSDRRFPLRTESLEVFKLFWANHHYGTEETRGVFQKFEWNDIEFFLLDDRYHRSPNKMPNTEEKEMFGKEQLRWLRESLISSYAPFKIIVGGNQMLVSHKDETFANFPHEQQELLRWIKENRIPGVLFLSGDRHFAQLNCLNDTSLYPLYDFTSSSLTAGLSTHIKEEDSPLRIPGTFVNDAHNFGLLRFDGPRKDRKLTMECYDKNGKLRWSHIIKASELKPKE